MFDEVSRPYRGSLDHTLKSTVGDSKLSLHDTFCVYIYIYIYIYIHIHTHTHTREAILYLCTYRDKRASQVALLVKNAGDGRVVG